VNFGRACTYTGGFAALVELLTVYHLDDVGGYYQIEDTHKQESED